MRLYKTQKNYGTVVKTSNVRVSVLFFVCHANLPESRWIYLYIYIYLKLYLYIEREVHKNWKKALTHYDHTKTSFDHVPRYSYSRLHVIVSMTRREVPRVHSCLYPLPQPGPPRIHTDTQEQRKHANVNFFILLF